jgi:hypothetical protein
MQEQISLLTVQNRKSMLLKGNKHLFSGRLWEKKMQEREVRQPLRVRAEGVEYAENDEPELEINVHGFVEGLNALDDVQYNDTARRPELRDMIVREINERYAPEGISVEPSKYGFGVFTSKPIKSGEVLGEYDGLLVAGDLQKDSWFEESGAVDNYHMMMSKRNGDLIIGDIMREGEEAPWVFVNDPGNWGEANVKFVERKGKILMVATRNITPTARAPKIELFVKYGDDYWKGNKEYYKKN